MVKAMIKCGVEREELDAAKQIITTLHSASGHLFTITDSMLAIQTAIPDVILMLYDIEKLREIAIELGET